MKPNSDIKFFIVFKDSFSRMLYSQYLGRLGFKNNILLESGEDCLKKLDLKPHVIFMDLTIDPKNGLETLKKVRKINAEIHTLVMVAPDQKQVLAEAVGLGASGGILRGSDDLEMIRQAVLSIKASISFLD